MHRDSSWRDACAGSGGGGGSAGGSLPESVVERATVLYPTSSRVGVSWSVQRKESVQTYRTRGRTASAGSRWMAEAGH